MSTVQVRLEAVITNNRDITGKLVLGQHTQCRRSRKPKCRNSTASPGVYWQCRLIPQPTWHDFPTEVYRKWIDSALKHNAFGNSNYLCRPWNQFLQRTNNALKFDSGEKGHLSVSDGCMWWGTSWLGCAVYWRGRRRGVCINKAHVPMSNIYLIVFS